MNLNEDQTLRHLIKFKLIPEVKRLVRRQRRLKRLVIDLSAILDKHYSALTRRTEESFTSLNDKLEEVLTRLRK